MCPAGGADTTIAADFQNFGSLSVDSGVIAFTRTFTQDAGGTLNVNISSAVTFDVFAITQGATLDGTLDITLVGGYMPGLVDSFQIMTFGSLTGTFATVNGTSIGNGNQFDVVYNANDVTLDVIPE